MLTLRVLGVSEAAREGGVIDVVSPRQRSALAPPVAHGRPVAAAPTVEDARRRRAAVAGREPTLP